MHTSQLRFIHGDNIRPTDNVRDFRFISKILEPNNQRSLGGYSSQLKEKRVKGLQDVSMGGGQ